MLGESVRRSDALRDADTLVLRARSDGRVFRTDINGLRAIAVLAVVVFHFRSTVMPGGFAGVDIFFVISGFLMTSIIRCGLDDGSFHLLDFYRRRVERIVPALIVLCAVLMLGGWLVLLPGEYAKLARHAVSSLLFVSNVDYWHEASGYFAEAARRNWLLHTWTLSVEWQFYLSYPLLLMALERVGGGRHTDRALQVACVAGFLACAYLSYTHAGVAFYWLPARAWELLLGGVVTTLPALAARWRTAEAWGGYALIAAGLAFAHEGMAWPGVMALLPTLGAAAVIHAARDVVLTSNRASQAIGTASYSLYLWHLPIIVYLYRTGLDDDALAVLIGVCALGALSAASYHLVETGLRPRLRRPRIVRRWVLPSFGALATLSVAVAALNGVRGWPRTDATRAEQAYVDRYTGNYQAHAYLYHRECNAHYRFATLGRTDISADCIASQKGGIFIWGDSHAEVLSAGLRAALPRSVPVHQAVSYACRPGFGIPSISPAMFVPTCRASNRAVPEMIARAKPETVLLVMQGGQDEEDWYGLAARLRHAGVAHVVMLGPLPRWKAPLTEIIAEGHWADPSPMLTDPLMDASFLSVDAVAQQRFARGPITYISMSRRLCRAERCLARVPGTAAPMQEDTQHLTFDGSQYIARTIVVPELARLGLIPSQPGIGGKAAMYAADTKARQPFPNSSPALAITRSIGRGRGT